eukprot:SAG22_NODE_1162_length_5301_cov_1.628604_8_plen_109_part_00
MLKEDISKFALSDMAKKDECRQLFDEIDTDRNGLLDSAELALLPKKLGHLIPRRHLMHAVEEMEAMQEGKWQPPGVARDSAAAGDPSASGVRGVRGGCCGGVSCQCGG